MDTRVTLQSIVQGAMGDTRRLSDQLASLQAQAADGKKFQHVSVDPLLGQLLDLANTQQNGAFIFSGIATHTEPFGIAAADAQGRPLDVQYQGASAASSMFVDRTQQIGLDYAGDQIFQGMQRQA